MILIYSNSGDDRLSWRALNESLFFVVRGTAIVMADPVSVTAFIIAVLQLSQIIT